eukprot:SAG22_NODE_2563_length_2436_cov_4.994009_1_plen_221_part_00
MEPEPFRKLPKAALPSGPSGAAESKWLGDNKKAYAPVQAPAGGDGPQVEADSEPAAEVADSSHNKEDEPSLWVDKLCDENQVSFTMPGKYASRGFHLRFRISAGGKVLNVTGAERGQPGHDSWQNLLLARIEGDSTWSSAFFSPKLKFPSQKTGTTMPPPVLLDDGAWERRNLVHTCGTRDQYTAPKPGELRIFTLSGIRPSTDVRTPQPLCSCGSGELP